MKFIKLDSRGGNYLVVAENVAWLRSAENGQTNVGIIGSQPLLVVGSVEDVAAKILAGTGPEELAISAADPASAPAQVPSADATLPASSTQAVTSAQEPEHEPEPELVVTAPEAKQLAEPVTTEPESIVEAEPQIAPEPARPVAAQSPAKISASGRPKAASARSASLWERSPAATPAATESLKVKTGSQRMMGRLE